MLINYKEILRNTENYKEIHMLRNTKTCKEILRNANYIRNTLETLINITTKKYTEIQRRTYKY